MVSLMKTWHLSFIFPLAFSFFSFGCGGDDSSASEQTFSGAVALVNGDSGTIEISIPESAMQKTNIRAQGSSSVNITGRCIYPDSSVNLAGSFDSDTGDFTLTGNGFTFTGNLDSATGAFTGSVTDDDGVAGSFSGVTSGNDVLVFCGTFTADDAGTGVWILVVNESTATGSYAGTLDSKSLIGTRDGDTIGVAVPGDEAIDGETGAWGTISGDELNGTIYREGAVDGNFEGSTSACP
jgi:hypothetical protein